MNVEKIEKENYKMRGMDWLLSKLAEECSEFSAAWLQYKNKIDITMKEKDVNKLYYNMIAELVDVKVGLNHVLSNMKDEDVLFIMKERENNKYKKIAKKIKELKNALQ